MKADGRTTSALVKAMSVIPTTTNTKVISKKAKPTARVFTVGPMARYTTASGVVELKKAMVCGKVFSEILTLASGRTAKPMGTGCISGKTEIDMRASGGIA